MARRTFFSFDYRFVWKVNQIRNIPEVTGTAAAGFVDASIWEEAKKKGDEEIKRMIDAALNNTSVTLVCVNYGTATRKYINYEIDRSLARGNGLFAVVINHLKDSNRRADKPGAIPSKIASNALKVYKYTNIDAFGRWIEEAAKVAWARQLGRGLGGYFARK